MKRVTLEQLSQYAHASSYRDLVSYIYGQVEMGSLKPVRASKTNGKKPALYREYWLLEQKADYRAYEQELSYQMSTLIHTDYYLRHLEQYAKDRVWVLQLNQFLLRMQEFGSVPEVSMNERSFEIWGREKFLREGQGKKILKRCGMDTSQLSFYDTSEPMAYYSRTRETPQNLLILENKDTFYSMRRYFLNGKEQIFHVPFGTLLYGAGKGVMRSFEDFSLCAEPYMQDFENGFYYFGDLDYEGIGIYERLAQSMEGRFYIEPFTAAYRHMLQKARTAVELPPTKEKQNRSLTGYFFQFFTDEEVCGMKEILESGRYIPQEIINISDLQA